jgi:hypothetical protein
LVPIATLLLDSLQQTAPTLRIGPPTFHSPPPKAALHNPVRLDSTRPQLISVRRSYRETERLIARAGLSDTQPPITQATSPNSVRRIPLEKILDHSKGVGAEKQSCRSVDLLAMASTEELRAMAAAPLRSRMAVSSTRSARTPARSRTF